MVTNSTKSWNYFRCCKSVWQSWCDGFNKTAAGPWRRCALCWELCSCMWRAHWPYFLYTGKQCKASPDDCWIFSGEGLYSIYVWFCLSLCQIRTLAEKKSHWWTACTILPVVCIWSAAPVYIQALYKPISWKKKCGVLCFWNVVETFSLLGSENSWFGFDFC